MIRILGVAFSTAGVLFSLACLAAWVTHVVVAINYLTSEVESTAYAVLVLIGCFVPPIGVMHGMWLWIGAW